MLVNGENLTTIWFDEKLDLVKIIEPSIKWDLYKTSVDKWFGPLWDTVPYSNSQFEKEKQLNLDWIDKRSKYLLEIISYNKTDIYICESAFVDFAAKGVPKCPSRSGISDSGPGFTKYCVPDPKIQKKTLKPPKKSLRASLSNCPTTPVPS